MDIEPREIAEDTEPEVPLSERSRDGWRAIGEGCYQKHCPPAELKNRTVPAAPLDEANHGGSN